MKSLLLLGLCAIIATVKCQGYSDIISNCAQQEGLTNSEKANFSSILRGDNPPKSIKCVVACYLETLKVLTNDNKLNLEVFEQNISKLIPDDSKAAVTKAAEDCEKSVNSSNRCDLAWEFERCTKQSLIKLG